MKLHAGWIALLLAPGLASAQPLSLRDAVDAALANEPSLAAAAADRDASLAAADEARAVLAPQLNLTGSAMLYEEPMVVSPIHGFTPGTIPDFDTTLIQSSLSASWLLWDGGAARARARQASAAAGAADENVALIRQALIARTVAAYTSVVAAAENLAAEQSRLEALATEERRVELLAKVGRAADVEVFRVEAARAAGEAARTTASTRLSVAESALARLTGLPRDRARAENVEQVRVADPAAADEATALAASPRVTVARQQLAAAEAALVAAGAGRKPQVSLASAVNEYGSGELDFTFEWNAGVQLRLPVIDGGATRARIARARANAAAAQARVSVAENDVLSDLDRAAAEVRNAGARAESLATAEQRYAEIARVERLRLELGAGTQSEYLRAEADLVAARAALAGARQILALAHVELARISGSLDAAWIGAHLRNGQ